MADEWKGKIPLSWCLGCKWCSPKEYLQYKKLWPYLHCLAAVMRKNIWELERCPKAGRWQR